MYIQSVKLICLEWSICSLQVVFEGVIGSSYFSDIAIDDVSIVPGACATPGSCNFEQGLCGYSNVQGDEFDWTRSQGLSPSFYTGPNVDHTTNSGSGYYVFIESSNPQKQGDRAWLKSSSLSATTGKCLQFWYSMYGSGEL